MADGLHHGINLYAYDGDLNIGDLRIWRAKDRPCFERREAALLDAILPHFRNALRNARVLGRTSERAGLWEGLLDISREALFLFDESGTLCFRNRTAGLMERKLPEKAYAALFARVRSLVGGDLSQTRWGPFFLSVQRILPPHNPRPYAAVTAYREERTGLGRERLQGTFHLSPRETDIALLVCKGLTDREIASALGIAFSTVRTHLKHLFQKLEATTRSELIFVLLEGIVDISF
ncbi:MAG: hypothetical protein JW821_10000 [Deltaproteobacteria bacterium]|nr:hypothetical protein [Deltaproteobacteria bacterium]